MSRILIDDIIEYRKRIIPSDMNSFLDSHKKARHVGSGCYRCVYESIGDDEDYVIKVGAYAANREDYEHFSSGSKLFPKAIAAGDLYDWIAVEKVKNVHDLKVFEESLLLAFPRLKELDALFSKFDTSKKTRVSRFLSAHSEDFNVTTSSFLGLIGNNDMFGHGRWSRYNKPTFRTFLYNVLGHNPELLRQHGRIMEMHNNNNFKLFIGEVEKNDFIMNEFLKAYKYLMKSEKLTSFLKLIDDFKPLTQEMFPSNLGFIPKDNRIVIIDSQK